jgi:hypothetical protein
VSSCGWVVKVERDREILSEIGVSASINGEAAVLLGSL